MVNKDGFRLERICVGTGGKWCVSRSNFNRNTYEQILLTYTHIVSLYYVNIFTFIYMKYEKSARCICQQRLMAENIGGKKHSYN
jgi:hypothetical protein